jgi:hypothetical protein
MVQYARREVGLKKIVACINPENRRFIMALIGRLSWRPLPLTAPWMVGT